MTKKGNPYPLTFSGEELTDEDLAFCLHHMNFTEDAVRNWFRNFRAECPDGKLSKEHLNGLFNRIFPEGESEVFCGHIFRSFDDDNNGFLDFKVSGRTVWRATSTFLLNLLEIGT